MEKLTWPQAFNKITEAYIKGEIKPLDSNFCFCGTLSPTGRKWNISENFLWDKDKSFYAEMQYDHPQPYTIYEYKRMEFALIYEKNNYSVRNYVDTDSEDALFAGMSAALYVLKEIHRSRGEDVDEIQTPFTQRKFQTT